MFVSNWEDDEEGVEEKDMNDPKEQFLTAAEEGDLTKLQELYTKNSNFLHVQDRDKYTALHRAAYNNHPDHCATCWSNVDVVDVLLKHGVECNAHSNGQVAPIHLAINSAEDPKSVIATVKRLLQAPGIFYIIFLITKVGLDLKASTGAGDTPLMLAKRTSKELTDLITDALTKV